MSYLLASCIPCILIKFAFFLSNLCNINLCNVYVSIYVYQVYGWGFSIFWKSTLHHSNTRGVVYKRERFVYTHHSMDLWPVSLHHANKCLHHHNNEQIVRFPYQFISAWWLFYPFHRCDGIFHLHMYLLYNEFSKLTVVNHHKFPTRIIQIS